MHVAKVVSEYAQVDLLWFLCYRVSMFKASIRKRSSSSPERPDLSAYPKGRASGDPGCDLLAAKKVADNLLQWEAAQRLSAADPGDRHMRPADPWASEHGERLAHQELQEFAGASILYGLRGDGHNLHLAEIPRHK